MATAKAAGGQWLRGAVVGFLGGLLAAGAMSLAHRVVGSMMAEPAAPPRDDATVKVASAAPMSLRVPRSG
jgi:hypothetical protein